MSTICDKIKFEPAFDAAEIKINPHLISEADYEIGCRILDGCIRRFFEQPGVREDYEKWKKEVYDVEEQKREQSERKNQRIAATA